MLQGYSLEPWGSWFRYHRAMWIIGTIHYLTICSLFLLVEDLWADWVFLICIGSELFNAVFTPLFFYFMTWPGIVFYEYCLLSQLCWLIVIGQRSHNGLVSSPWLMEEHRSTPRANICACKCELWCLWLCLCLWLWGTLSVNIHASKLNSMDVGKKQQHTTNKKTNPERASIWLKQIHLKTQLNGPFCALYTQF